MRPRKAQIIWQELVKDKNNELRTMKVIDFGITKSARKKASKEQPTAHTNPKANITVGVEMSENLPRTRTKNITSVEQEEQQENKRKKNPNSEAATEEEGTLRKHR